MSKTKTADIRTAISKLTKPNLLLYVNDISHNHAQRVKSLNDTIEVRDDTISDLKSELYHLTKSIEKLEVEAVGRKLQKEHAVSAIKTVFAVNHPNTSLQEVERMNIYSSEPSLRRVDGKEPMPSQEVLTLRLLLAILAGNRRL